MSAPPWTLFGWGTLMAVGALAVAAPDAAETVRWAPLLLGLLVFALPHGAVDHHVPRRLGRPGGRAFVVRYAVAAAAGLALWAAAPRVTLVLFFVVAAAHWGSGDAWYARAVHGRGHFAGRLDAWLFVASRGALPVALPAVAHPEELARGTDAILRVVDGGMAPVLSGPVRITGLAAVAVLAAAAAASALWATRRRPRAGRVDVFELALLAAFFTITPAILAVGTYLLAWHAPRHVVRLIASDPAQAALPAGRALVAWTREAAPLTLVSLAGLALLGAAAWTVPAEADAVAAAALALIAALTFPHAAVVAWMDRVQGVFATDRGA